MFTNYEYINKKEANRIKEILLCTSLENTLKIESKKLKLKLFANNISKAKENKTFNNMTQVNLMNGNSEDVLIINNKNYPLYYNIGDWGYQYRINNVHICLGTNKFGKFFSQLELSQALKDDEYIYIIKNITRLGGKGSITRLYRGLKSNKKLKELRKQQLIEKFGGESLCYDGHEWICINKIPLNKLYKKSEAANIYYEFLNDFIRFAFLVEEICLT